MRKGEQSEGGSLKEKLLTEEKDEVAFQACSQPGDGIWLTATLANDGRNIGAPLFREALKRRLRGPMLNADSTCPGCGQVMVL
jgi:hypothetical protein